MKFLKNFWLVKCRIILYNGIAYMNALIRYMYELGKKLGEKLFGEDKSSLDENLPITEKKQCNATNVEAQE